MRNIFTVALLVVLVGCASTASKIWPARVGIYTYDQTVTELGPPDKEAHLADGSVVADWLTQRGYMQTQVYGDFGPRYGYSMYPMVTQSRSPDYFLRLTFGPDRVLRDWRSFAR